MLALPMSISRGLVISVVIIFTGGYFGLYRTRKTRRFLPRIIITLTVIILVAKCIPAMDEAMMAFTQRWENSTGEKNGGIESAIGGRIIESFLAPFDAIFHNPIFGQGIGKGTNAGSKMLTGEVTFLIAETEWLKLIGELGAILGFVYIIYRCLLTSLLFRLSWTALGTGLIFPWLLFLCNAHSFLMGNWGQPTVLGFTCFIAGLNIAACNTWSHHEYSESHPLY